MSDNARRSNVGLSARRSRNVRIARRGRLAHVFADFKFTSGNTTRAGQLMLLMVAVKGEFKISALTFTYHLDS